MRAIGYSTGALAKGDFDRGLALQRGIDAIDAIELSALRDHELPAQVDAVPRFDPARFAYVSIPAPAKLDALDEETVFELLSRPIVAHPDILRTPSNSVRGSALRTWTIGWVTRGRSIQP